MSDARTEPAPRVVIVGGGFGGLSAAKALAGQPFDITLIDRNNHHLFQPLLYQVATAGLSPADIASPIRGILSGQKNASVMLAEVSRASISRARRSSPTAGACPTTIWCSRPARGTPISATTTGRRCARV